MADGTLSRFGAGDFASVLCVAAHPDDLEYGTSCAVAAWTASGIEVGYLMLTRGEAGMDSTEPERTRWIRTDDELAAARAVGVGQVDFLDHPDGVLEYGLPLRRDVARAIRTHKPDAVVTGSWEMEQMGGLSMADHRVAGLVTVDAVRDAGNRWVFRDLLDDGLEPHPVRWLLVAGDDNPTHAVEIDDRALEAGVASLAAHAGYLAGITGHPPAEKLVPAITGMGGRAIGVPHAVLFRAMDLQAPPPGAEELFGS